MIFAHYRELCTEAEAVSWFSILPAEGAAKEYYPVASGMSSKITPPTVSAGPSGFDDDGRRVIKDVGEFRLVEMWFPGGPIIVEYSKEIRAALAKARYRISDRDGITTPHERAMLAAALNSLILPRSRFEWPRA